MKTITITNRYDEEMTIEVGKTVVGFKSDIEQYGRVIKIKKNYWGDYQLVIENENGFDGEYIGGETTTVQDAEDCWTE